MLSFIDILVVIDVENVIRVIDVNEGTQVLEIPSPPGFDATFVVHPWTYMNKVSFLASSIKLNSELTIHILILDCSWWCQW